MKALFIALAVLAVHTSFSQTATKAGDANLSVQWEVVENNHAGKREVLSAFTFTAGDALPAKGWALYFNFPRGIRTETVTGGMAVDFINGEFYRLRPTSAFRGLSPKDSLRVTFVAGAWAVNVTDAPAGLYMVWDDAPAKGHPITSYAVKPSTRPEQLRRYAGDKLLPPTPQSVFEQNRHTVDVPENKLTKIFPTPASYKESGGVFRLANGYRTASDDAVRAEAAYLKTALDRMLSGPASGTDVTIRLKKLGPSTDAYKLSVTPKEITISSGTERGVFYGVQSLLTLIPPQAYRAPQPVVNIPTVEVADSPRFGHRALSLDVARNFQTKEEVMKVLHLMALYKLNVFHFHITDDEGWRLQIPGLPELTEAGVRKGHAANDSVFLHPSYGSGPEPTTAGSGFYTREDFIAILRYAKERHIDVIPEIETPGHARAAVAAMTVRYNRLMKEGKQGEAEEFLLYHPADASVYKSVQRWTRNVIDPALPSTYRFLEKVVDEIAAMYKEAEAPLRTVHFGGDEVPNGVWTGSPAVRQLMMENASVKNVDDVWYNFYGKVSEMMKRHGLWLYGWEELGLRKTTVKGKTVMVPNRDFANGNTHVDVWNNVIGWGAEDLAYRMANAGYKVVLSPVSNLYLDMAYQKSFDEPGYYWGSYVDAEKPFAFIPFNYYKNATQDVNGNPVGAAYFKNKERLTAEGRRNIVGLQGLLWAEALRSPDAMEYMLLPKLLSLAERAWAGEPAWAIENDSAKAAVLYRQDWSRFASTVGKRELLRLDYYAGGFAYRIPTPGSVVKNGRVEANVQFPGLVIRYTTDGSEPTAASPLYTTPIDAKGIVKLKAFSASGRSGRLVEVVNR